MVRVGDISQVPRRSGPAVRRCRLAKFRSLRIPKLFEGRVPVCRWKGIGWLICVSVTGDNFCDSVQVAVGNAVIRATLQSVQPNLRRRRVRVKLPAETLLGRTTVIVSALQVMLFVGGVVRGKPCATVQRDTAAHRSVDRVIPAMTENSVTQWIADLKSGDPKAAEQLADRYFNRLVTLARRQLGNAPRRVADEEDIAVSVFQRLCTGADKGAFPQLDDRNDLWAVLLTVTKGKVADQIKYLTRQKRGGGDVRGHSVFQRGEDIGPAGFEQCVEEELTPEFIAQLDEEHQRLLNLLRDDSQRRIAVWKMEGYSNDDIADRLQISVKSVERKLRHIREKWAGEVA